ncbi:unnamed protein product (macronuclear) [Paramecium tetraurelia]|uniref:Splicing factor YJU2 n=1 Tax=Paramecium tetraurelia TaxID=5888 RepID=A0BYM7_PARTE|nr:uncharacterized protein GSPATT00033497001 [Paramecium tetraurelia]CAK63644.1 unnamed protein product [Paramecium tetraurelia]|eukprot:XP_001431042.1 hypothetical protein (macronuclear) [Paramecium tetraurelia strain d4-2]
MAERKVLVKYYPPDFDPKLLPNNHRPKGKQDNVRNMLPMTVKCNHCGNYLYIGTKFNMRKETVWTENYLGILIHRFYFKCTYCYAEITFKTDPRNHDYIVEGGGTRNYDPYRDAKAAEEVLKQMRANEEQGDSMKFLENKTHDSKKEMDILDAIDDTHQLNRRQTQFTPDMLLKQLFYDLDALELQEEWEKQKEFKDQFKVKRVSDVDDKEDKTMHSVTQHLKQVVIQQQPKQVQQQFVKPKFVKKQVCCEKDGEKVGVSKEEEQDEINIKQEIQTQTLSLVDDDYSD